MTARTEDEWIYALRAATLEVVKALLNAEDPPSFNDMKVLPWVTTSHFGVYGRTVWGGDFHVYVGSATGRYGLKGRKMRHEHINAARKEPCLHHSLLVDPSQPRDGSFSLCFGSRRLGR